jgi:hypothetical protein
MKKIMATVLINKNQCILGINAQAEKTKFRWLSDNSIATDQGDVIDWPNETSKEEVLAMLRQDMRSVFVVEFGPGGVPLTETEISI